MIRQINVHQWNAGSHDGDNSSPTNSVDQGNDQYSFNPFGQIGSDSLFWAARSYGVEKRLPAHFSWGAGSGPSPKAGSAASASPSNGAPGSLGVPGASGSSSGGGSAPTAAASSNSSSGNSSAPVSTPGSGLVFVNTYDPACTTQFEACVVAAEKQLECLFTNSDTINVTFDEASTAPSTQNPYPYALGNTSYGYTYSYSTLRAALLKAAPGDVLPSTDPSGGANWWIPEAYGRMLGLTSATGSPDLTVTLNTYYAWDFGQDVINGLTHELSEGGMGRFGGLGGPRTPTNDTWSTMDLFRYNASGQPDYTNGRDGETTYFSSDGGATLSNGNDPAKGAPTLSFNNQYNADGTFNNGGDSDDWSQTQVFGATGGGETLTLTQTELDVMEALGWNLSLKQDVFNGALSGWETPTDWSTGSMPVTPQDAYIGGVSGGMIVTLDSNVTVHSISTGADAEFDIGDSTACTLIATDGTAKNSEDSGGVVSGNYGSLCVEPGSALQIGNTFDNYGALAIGRGAGGVGDVAFLYLNDTLGPVTLDDGGTVDLGQAANPSQSEIETEGFILTAPGTSGDGLYNVDNTITGGGDINLGVFDNQASGKVDASQAGGFWLTVSASAFSNEGVMTAESGATLNLGADGATETLTNTGNGTTSGAINIDSGGRLAISGDFTLTGSGAVSFNGAGAAITSDVSGATTFTNDSTIVLEASLGSSGAFSGQIGDEGIWGINDLTFLNNGTTRVDGSGYALTINTGGNTLTNGSSGTIEAESGATVTIVANVNNQGTISAGTSSSTGTVDLGQDASAGSTANSGTIDIWGGSDLAISGAYTVTGSGCIGLKRAGADITSDGNAAATFTNESTIDALASSQIGDEGIKASNDLTFVNIGSVIALGPGVTLTLNTGSHTIDDGGGTLEAENGATLAINSNVDTGQPASGSPPGGTIDAGPGGTVILSAKAANGVSGASVPGQVKIDGGTFEMLAGSSVTVPIEFTSKGGTLEISSVTITSAGGRPPTVSTATFDADETVLDEIVGGFAISDTAADISANLNDLSDPHIASITVSDSAPVVVSVSQLTSDAAQIGKLVNADATPYELAVTDSLAAIVGDLGALNANSHVSSLSATSGSATLSGGVGIAAPTFSLLNSGATLTVGENLAYSGAFTEAAGSNVSISANATMTLSGSSTLTGSTSGAGGLTLGGGTVAINGGANLTQAKLTLSGAATAVALNETLSYAGTFLQNANPTLSIASGDTLTLTGSSTLTGSISGAGALTLGGGTVAINGGAKLTEAKLTLSGAATAVTLNKNLSYGGTFLQNANPTLSIASGDTLTLTGSSTLTGSISGAGALTLGGGAVAINGGAKLTEAKLTLSGAATKVTLNENLSYGGTFLQNANPTLSIASGDTLTLTGSSTMTGSISGAGALTLGGGTVAINGGAKLTEAKLTLSGAATKVTLNENLSYGGTFLQNANPTLSIASGDALTLTGSSTLTGSISGAGGLTLGGGAVAINSGAKLTEAKLTLSGAGTAVTLNENLSYAGTWDITDDSGIGLGASASSAITNNGLFEKTDGTGTSAIAPAFTNAHNILVSSGTLDFQGAVSGTGTDTINGASTLEVDSTLGANQAINFSGSGGALDLADPLGYAGSHIGGFAAGDHVGFAGAWSLLSFSENSADTLGTLTLTNGTNHVALEFAGSFTKSDFSIATRGTTIIEHT